MSLVLRRLAQWNYICVRGKPLPPDLYAMLKSSEYSRLIITRFSRLKPKQQFSTTLGTRMLREEKHAGLGALRSSPVTEPCGHRHSRNILRCDSCHVEHDGAEPASLQQQVGDPECLFNS
jgi:hypothetical protein